MEKSINLKAWEVQAFLKGRKTQKRMVTKLKPPYAPGDEPRMAWNFGDYKPRFSVGTVLWVRETWCNTWPFSKSECTDGPCYKATDEGECGAAVTGQRWNLSTHMPRKLARLFLEVTMVRLERLDDISEEDAAAEGVYLGSNGHYADYPSGQTCPGWKSAIPFYKSAWNADNPKHPWGTNPWVEVYTFKVLEGYK
jgi:hypothetical protein